MYVNSIITHFFSFFFLFSLFSFVFFSFVVFFSFSNQQKYIHVCTIVVNMPHSTVDMPFTYCFFFLAPKNCITIITYYKVVTQIGVCTYKAMRHVSLW